MFNLIQKLQRKDGWAVQTLLNGFDSIVRGYGLKHRLMFDEQGVCSMSNDVKELSRPVEGLEPFKFDAEFLFDFYSSDKWKIARSGKEIHQTFINFYNLINENLRRWQWR